MNSTPHTFREYDENGNMIDTVIIHPDIQQAQCYQVEM